MTSLINWRIVGGLGIGIASVIAPAYIAEIAPARYRGALASTQQLAIALGLCTAVNWIADFVVSLLFPRSRSRSVSDGSTAGSPSSPCSPTYS